MESIIRDVRDMDNRDREAIEHVVGQSLRDDQKLIIQILSSEATVEGQPTRESILPAWCNVYEGLSDAEIADVEKSIVRSDSTRSECW
jgi:hypothetical protein